LAAPNHVRQTGQGCGAPQPIFCERLQKEIRAARQPRPANRDRSLPHRGTDNPSF
jgi:hypothetical protein